MLQFISTSLWMSQKLVKLLYQSCYENVFVLFQMESTLLNQDKRKSALVRVAFPSPGQLNLWVKGCAFKISGSFVSLEQIRETTGRLSPLQGETGIQITPPDVVSGRPVSTSTALLHLLGPYNWISDTFLQGSLCFPFEQAYWEVSLTANLRLCQALP